MSNILKIELLMICGAILGFVALALIGRSLQASGTVRDPAAIQRTVFPILMALFMLFGLGLIGLGLHFFISAQGRIGNADLQPVSFLRRSEIGVTIGAWIFLSLGFAIAYPFMKRDMVGPDPPQVGPSTGILRAEVGQTLDDVRRQSTLPIAATHDVALDHSSRTIGEGVFDFEIPGSVVRFEQCRYYFISTGPQNTRAIDSINIGISPFKKPRAEIESDEAAIRKRLADDSWEQGRFVWKTERERMLSGGAPTSGEGRYWAKGKTLLILSAKRMDEAKPGEDPRTAGEYILYLDIVPRNSSSYATLDYSAPTPPGGASK